MLTVPLEEVGRIVQVIKLSAFILSSLKEMTLKTQ